MQDDFDLYDALNVQRGASAEDVRVAFRELSRIYHPDKRGPAGADGAGAGSEEAFVRIHRAYRVLGDDTLRAFYDRYGLPGVRLAEDLSDEEGEAEEAGAGGRLSVPEDRLKDLEGRVLRAMRRRQELRAQRLLGLQGSFTLSALAAPGPHGAHLRRRYRLQYSAVSQTVQLTPCEPLRLTVGCAAHVQGANGVGASKLMLAASSRLGPLTNLRAGLSLSGGRPDGDLSLVRTLTPHCMVQQKATLSSDGATLALTLHPWLTRGLRGSIGWALGEEPGLTLGLVGRSSSSGHSAQASLSLQPGAGELGVQLKYKPARDFSLRLAPSLSPNGWAVQATCVKAAGDGLTKLYWAIRLRSRSLSLRLTLSRAGLRFCLPLELWPEAAGPVPPVELGLGLALWTLPPLAIRLLWCAGQAASRAAGTWLDSRASSGEAKEAPKAEPTAAPAEAADDPQAAEARAQRRLAAAEARRRRGEEAARRGLEILAARYGDPAHVADPGETVGPGVVDVTDCLMARVRLSRLHLSGAPKSSLLGFHDPREDRAAGPPALHVSYRFGTVKYERTFGDREVVMLP